MKFFLIILSLFILNFSCNLSQKENSFCTRKSGWDYHRIPLTQKTELIRLNGSENWIFSLDRNKIDSPIVSALINVRKIGMNETSFILISEEMEYNNNVFESRAIKVISYGEKKNVIIFKSNYSIDSIFLDKATYSWYDIDDVWEQFNTKGIVPWCK
jgi:hypothetical protein